MFGRLGRDFGRLGANSGGALGWIPNPANSPDIAINWTTNQAWLKTTGLTTPAALGIATSRASVKQVVDSNGNWSQVASNVTAMSNLGRSTEEARTNSITFSDSPLVANSWALENGGTTTIQTGGGPGSGLDAYLWDDGTTATVTHRIISPANVSVTVGQTWTFSAFVKYVNNQWLQLAFPSASFGVSAYANFDIQNGLVGTVGASSAASIKQYANGWCLIQVSATATATAASQSVFLTLAAATNTSRSASYSAAHGQFLQWNAQFENNSINSTVASATVAAGGASGVSGTAVYSVGGGTGTAATLNVTVSGGAITAINSVASAGIYSVFPPSPAALTYVSGTGSGVVGATVNLTPTNLAANAFATSPIKTTAGSATRAADVTTLAATVGSAYSLFSQLTPQSPSGYTLNQGSLMLSDGTGNNRAGMFRVLSGGLGTILATSGGVAGAAPAQTTALAQNSQSKWASSFGVNIAQSLNGAAALTVASTVFPTAAITQLHFGDTGLGGGQLDGLAAIDAIWLTQAVPSAQLVTMTT